MPAKWINVFNSYGDAYDYTIKLKKIKSNYELYFLQVAPDFLKDGVYPMFSNCERVMNWAEIKNGVELILAFKDAEESDDIIYNENPGIDIIIAELAKYPFLKELCYQGKEMNS